MNNSKPDNDYSTDKVNNASSKRPTNTLECPDDLHLWAVKQSRNVHILFIEAWISDRYGNRTKQGVRVYKRLNTSLVGDPLRKAMKVLKDAGLFEFKPETENGNTYYLVWNLQGKYSGTWKLGKESDENSGNKDFSLGENNQNFGRNYFSSGKNNRVERQKLPKNEQKSLDLQNFQPSQAYVIEEEGRRTQEKKEEEKKESSGQVASLDATQPSNNLTEEEKVVRVVTMRVIENTRIVVPVRFADRFDKEVEAFKTFLENQPKPVDEQGFQDLANKEYEFLKGLFDQYQAGLDYSLVAV